MMEVFEGIRTLLAVRRYLDRAVPEPVIRKILEAGRLTASAMNLQPWHFIVIQVEHDAEGRLHAVDDPRPRARPRTSTCEQR
jgi:nitroreductase